MEVLAVTAHAENAEHVRVCRLGKGADLLRVGTVAVRTLDLGRARGRGGFTGGLGGFSSRPPGTIFCFPFFPIFKRTRIELRRSFDMFFS